MTLHSINQNNSGKKTAGKSWYDLLKYIFIPVSIIRSSSDHAVFSWIYNNCKYSLAVQTYDILMATKNILLLSNDEII